MQYIFYIIGVWKSYIAYRDACESNRDFKSPLSVYVFLSIRSNVCQETVQHVIQCYTQFVQTDTQVHLCCSFLTHFLLSCCFWFMALSWYVWVSSIFPKLNDEVVTLSDALFIWVGLSTTWCFLKVNFHKKHRHLSNHGCTLIVSLFCWVLWIKAKAKWLNIMECDVWMRVIIQQA